MKLVEKRPGEDKRKKKYFWKKPVSIRKESNNQDRLLVDLADRQATSIGEKEIAISKKINHSCAPCSSRAINRRTGGRNPQSTQEREKT